jgi:hypothetical protein
MPQPPREQMIITPDVRPLSIQQIGEAARGWLTPGRRGRVLAVVSNAIYLYTSQEEVFWLATKRIPMHRRGIRIWGPLPEAAIDAPFQVIGRQLVLGSKVALDFSQALVWKFNPPAAADVIAITDLAECVSTAFSTIYESLSPVGFGSLIPEILTIAQEPRASRLALKPAMIPALAWPAIQEITKACLAHDLPKILEQADSLVGLGEGLTPSGDDFIGGLLFCSTLLGRWYPDMGCFELCEHLNFMENYKPLTNLISFAMLKDHAEGHAVDTLHRFIQALLTGQPLDTVHGFASELTHIGHSTGWDLLAGVLTGMLLAFRVGEPNYIPSEQEKEMLWTSNRK